jgi:pimeloyl-ACP methyl ester carboxylesterase
MGTSVATELMARDLRGELDMDMTGALLFNGSLTDRWHGAIRDWPKPLTLAWGMQDPVARVEVLGGLQALRPGVETIELPDAAHYPQVEHPELISAALDVALTR